MIDYALQWRVSQLVDQDMAEIARRVRIKQFARAASTLVTPLSEMARSASYATAAVVNLHEAMSGDSP